MEPGTSNVIQKQRHLQLRTRQDVFFALMANPDTIGSRYVAHDSENLPSDFDDSSALCERLVIPWSTFVERSLSLQPLQGVLQHYLRRQQSCSHPRTPLPDRGLVFRTRFGPRHGSVAKVLHDSPCHVFLNSFPPGTWRVGAPIH